MSSVPYSVSDNGLSRRPLCLDPHFLPGNELTALYSVSGNETRYCGLIQTQSQAPGQRVTQTGAEFAVEAVG